MISCLMLMLSCLLGLGSAWNQPSTCYVQQTSCSNGDKKLGESLAAIQQTLAISFSGLQKSLTDIATSLNRLVGEYK